MSYKHQKQQTEGINFRFARFLNVKLCDIGNDFFDEYNDKQKESFYYMIRLLNLVMTHEYEIPSNFFRPIQKNGNNGSGNITNFSSKEVLEIDFEQVKKFFEDNDKYNIVTDEDRSLINFFFLFRVTTINGYAVVLKEVNISSVFDSFHSLQNSFFKSPLSSNINKIDIITFLDKEVVTSSFVQSKKNPDLFYPNDNNEIFAVVSFDLKLNIDVKKNESVANVNESTLQKAQNNTLITKVEPQINTGNNSYSYLFKENQVMTEKYKNNNPKDQLKVSRFDSLDKTDENILNSINRNPIELKPSTEFCYFVSPDEQKSREKLSRLDNSCESDLTSVYNFKKCMKYVANVENAINLDKNFMNKYSMLYTGLNIPDTLRKMVTSETEKGNGHIRNIYKEACSKTITDYSMFKILENVNAINSNKIYILVYTIKHFNKQTPRYEFRRLYLVGGGSNTEYCKNEFTNFDNIFVESVKDVAVENDKSVNGISKDEKRGIEDGGDLTSDKTKTKKQKN
ncbi:unnamed protein product [Brachionus calyciflorus]|uniref:Uncharacterized protein n=1 Tax=Brachionus calyciflorus TaxID=104777 RepID=A0A813VKA6_9BILA|nr:unnamed protein product [Brachionus calyciflorus]